MLRSPGAMQLRTLQTIDGLGASPSNTVLLMPVELLELARNIRPKLTNGAAEIHKAEGRMGRALAEQ